MNPSIVPKLNFQHQTNPNDNKYDKPPYKQNNRNPHVTFVIGHSFLDMKYCKICRIYRSSRLSHCWVCENCVEMFDHHCPWLGTCIARNNYPSFMKYVISNICSILTIVLGIVFMFCRHEYGSRSGWELVANAGEQYPHSVVIFIIALVSLVLCLSLLVYHCMIIITNQTTNEHLKKKWNLVSGNPNHQGIINNIKNRLIYQPKPNILNLQQLLNFPSQTPVHVHNHSHQQYQHQQQQLVDNDNHYQSIGNGNHYQSVNNQQQQLIDHKISINLQTDNLEYQQQQEIDSAVVESGDEFNSGDDQLNIRVNQKITYVRMNDHKKI